MDGIVAGFDVLFSWQNLTFLVLGLVGGFVVGVLPGFTGANAAAIVLPFSLGLSPEAALILMAGIYSGASFAGAVPAILMNVPGDAGSAATALDGYPMACRGQAQRAIGIARMASVMGGVIGSLVVLVVIAPMGSFALSFGAREMFLVTVFGLTVIAAVIGENVIKGLVSALLGLLIAAMSASPMTGQPRLTFGFLGLYEGIPFVPALIGLFAFTQMFLLASRRSLASAAPDGPVAETAAGLRAMMDEVWSGIAETMRRMGTVLRASFIGLGLGVIPGIGTAVASFITYAEAKRRAKNPEEFGTGAPEGIIASEACDNAVVAGTMVPTLTLGIPGSGTAAVMLGALYLHGIQPGPRLLTQNAPEAYAVLLAMLLAAILILPIGVLLGGPLSAITRLRPSTLVPVILVISCVGAFAVRNSVFDVGLAFAFGLVGFALTLRGYPVVPMVLALILGPIAEENFLRALSLGRGEVAYFFGSPTALALWGLLALTIGLRTLKWLRTRGSRTTAPSDDAEDARI